MNARAPCAVRRPGSPVAAATPDVTDCTGAAVKRRASAASMAATLPALPSAPMAGSTAGRIAPEPLSGRSAVSCVVTRGGSAAILPYSASRKSITTPTGYVRTDRPRRSSVAYVRTGRLAGKRAVKSASDIPGSKTASAGRTCPSIQT